MFRAWSSCAAGGRIGAAASLWGTMFSIKPILAVEDGKIVPLEKVRSAAKAVARLEEIVAADAAARPAGQARLAVHHFGNPAEAEQLAARAGRRALPACPPAQISALPAVLAAHAGLGVLAVIVGEEQRHHPRHTGRPAHFRRWHRPATASACLVRTRRWFCRPRRT